MTTFARLKEIDRRWKPTDSQRHWQAQSDLYHDHASDLVRARLREQGVGQANDLFPLHLNVLRRVVETLAVTYRRPASRYLRNPVGRRLEHFAARTAAKSHLVELVAHLSHAGTVGSRQGR